MQNNSKDYFNEIKKLYYGENLSMRETAQKLNISQNKVIYFMRKYNLHRRTFSEMNALRFKNKKPSFLINNLDSENLKELKAVGTMLYWGEGYKSDKGSSVDFANSDPEMIMIFLNFLRNIFTIDEKRLRILLYGYEDQDVGKLITFWHKLTKIPVNQFSKPYIRKDFKINNRKMKYGLIHIRYSDKKLLLQIKEYISLYKKKYNARIWEVDKPSGL